MDYFSAKHFWINGGNQRVKPGLFTKFALFSPFQFRLEPMDKLTLTFIRMDTAHQMKMMNVMWHSLAGRVACVLPRPFDRVRVRVLPPVHSLYLALPLHQFSGRKTEAAKRDELRSSKAEVHRRLELCPYTFLNFGGK